MAIRILTDNLNKADVAATLQAQTNLEEQLRALRHNHVPFIALRSAPHRLFILRYYPPLEEFIVWTAEPAIGDRPDVDRFTDNAVLNTRMQTLESLWARSVEIRLALTPHAARLLGTSVERLIVRYADHGIIETGEDPTRSQDALLTEIRRQLEYICNVKTEGPPLLQVLKSNLLFDGIFGFSGWGGRWPEFGSVIFNFHYDPTRDQFLITLRRTP